LISIKDLDNLKYGVCTTLFHCNKEEIDNELKFTYFTDNEIIEGINLADYDIYENKLERKDA
jgi:hypothetical protein